MGYQLIKLVQVLVALLGIGLVASASLKPASAQSRTRDRVRIAALEEATAVNAELNKEIVAALENAAAGVEQAQSEARRATAAAEQAQRDASQAQTRMEQLERELRTYRSTVIREAAAEQWRLLPEKVSDPTGGGLFRVRYATQVPITAGEVRLQSKKDPLAGVGGLSGIYLDANWQRYRFVHLRDGTIEMWLTHSSDPLEVQGVFRPTLKAGHYTGQLQTRKAPGESSVTKPAELNVYNKFLAIQSTQSLRDIVPDSSIENFWSVSFHRAIR